MANTGFKLANQSELWDKLNKGESKSLLKKHLTPELYEKLKDKKTSLGGTLGACIQSGCQNLQSGVGIYACDPEAYTVYKDLFDPIILDYHKVDKVYHPKTDWGTDAEVASLGDLDPSGQVIVSTRVRVGRSHKGMPFPPTVSDEQRKTMEANTVAALKTLPGDLGGTYYPLSSMSKEDEKQLVEDHFLFKDDDSCLGSAGGYTFWPSGRGIFHNKNKTFLTWINEEDHLRFISMQMGGNLGEVYGRLRNALAHLEKTIPFATKDGELGSLTFCPTNLGTAMRASVHIKVPNLEKSGKELDEICAKYNLQPRGIHGEHTESVGGVYDISNKRRMGLTEFDAVSEMKNGILKIMEREAELGAKK